MVANSTSMNNEISTVELEDFRKDPSAYADRLLLDVRESDEWAEGHLPGAVHIPLALVTTKIMDIVTSKDVPILIYCHTGGRAATAARMLREMGYTHVESMNGGWCQWVGNHC